MEITNLSTMTSDEELRAKAKKIAKEKVGFYLHFAIYLVVNLFIIVQWWVISGGEGFPWFVTTTGGWGIGIVAHFVAVFVVGPK